MARTKNSQPRDYIQCIYAFSGPDGRVRYIGKSNHATLSIAKLRTAIRKNSYPGNALHEWGKAIGEENIQVHIIEKLMTYDSIEAAERRAHFIDLFAKSADPGAPLLNSYTCNTKRGVEAREYTKKQRNRK